MTTVLEYYQVKNKSVRCSRHWWPRVFLQGDGMNAYMAYKVATQVSAHQHTALETTCSLAYRRRRTRAPASKEQQIPTGCCSCCGSPLHWTHANICERPFQTTLSMFRNKTFTVRRRFSDFLGLYEKLSEKHGPNGYIVPPPPEKSILGRLAEPRRVGRWDESLRRRR